MVQRLSTTNVAQQDDFVHRTKVLAVVAMGGFWPEIRHYAAGKARITSVLFVCLLARITAGPVTIFVVG